MYKTFVGKLDEKKPIVRSGRRWKFIINMVLKEIWCLVVEWIQPAQGRSQWRTFVNTAINTRFP
jgi:hypothetical protein